MEVVDTIEQLAGPLSQARARGESIGLVPTMGALHIGHIALIEAAVKACDCVVVSIFVNPTQFGPGEDFEKYPRDLETDLEICRTHHVDLVFAPSPEEMYGSDSVTTVTVAKLTDALCGRSRGAHFRGVTTVCTKLFNIVGPDIAFFGQKDGQQAAVIRRMVADLNVPLRIVVCPTIRESDGLAISSRNQYLSDDERADAPKIYEALRSAQSLIEAGETAVAAVVASMRPILRKIKGGQIEYVEIVDAETIEPMERIRGRVMVAVAVQLGSARLIDNIVVDSGER